MFSIAAASRNSTPFNAPLPFATMIDIGVARPIAQGQAMISTATALTSPNTQLVRPEVRIEIVSGTPTVVRLITR